jgi:alpha-beta hydrolase superfamily lysophospholipase
MSTPFSFTEIQQIPSFTLRQPSYVIASDGCKLAYYAYIPDKAHAAVIFYHGARLYGNAIYQWIAKELAEQHAMAAYIVDTRGHGNSEGARGDAPTIATVWNDVSAIIDHARIKHPYLPLYLAGHSSGAGLLLNYAAWPAHKKVNGLILFAPYLGPQSGALKERKNPALQFTKKVRTWVYIVAGITNGYFCAHIPAVYFNFPESILIDKNILEYYTYTMSLATTPYETKKTFQAITLPTSLFIASDDEQFSPDAIAQYAHYIPAATYRYTEIVDAKHLSILLKTPNLIAQSIDRAPQAI